MDFFWDIPNRKIHWICTFVAKEGELSFVGRYNEQDNGSAWLVLLYHLLKLAWLVSQ